MSFLHDGKVSIICVAQFTTSFQEVVCLSEGEKKCIHILNYSSKQLLGEAEVLLCVHGKCSFSE